METSMSDVQRLKSVADISRFHGREQPNKVALKFEGRDTTYRELDERSNSVANGLLAHGQEPGMRIGFIGKNQDRLWEVVMGSFKSRTAFVSVNWRLAPAEISYVLSNAECEILFVGEHFYHIVEEIRPQLPRLKAIIAMDGGHSSWPSYADWRAEQSADDPMLQSESNDDVFQLYSSGTTGRPKGVCLTNGNYLWTYRHPLLDVLPWGRDDVVLISMPMFHVAGIGPGMNTLASGGCAVITAEVNLDDILRMIPEHGVTQALIVPAVIQALIQVPGVEQVDFSSLRRISYGGSPIPEAVLSRAMKVFGCDFVQNYGLTETCGMCTYLSPRDHDPARGKLRTCGLPAPNRELRVVNESGETLPVGQVGEIVVRGGFVMKGYWKAPDATAEAIVDGWFHTGDAGYLDEDGYLCIHDRIKEMIVSGGENVYPAEVENALADNPDIADAAVVGVPDDKWGEAVKAVVVLKPGVKQDASAIIEHARARIAGYKLPKSVDFVELIPRNPSGKILRRHLREPYWQGRDRQVN